MVRYFTAWIDDGIVADDHLTSESSEDETLSSLTDGGRRPVLPPSSRGLDFISSSDTHIVFGNDVDADLMAEDDSQDESSDDGDVDQSSDSSDGQMEHDRDQLDGELSAIESKAAPESQPQTVWTVLYIQMEYCRPEVGPLSLTGSVVRTMGKGPPFIKSLQAAIEC